MVFIPCLLLREAAGAWQRPSLLHGTQKGLTGYDGGQYRSGDRGATLPVTHGLQFKLRKTRQMHGHERAESDIAVCNVQLNVAGERVRKERRKQVDSSQVYEPSVGKRLAAISSNRP